MTELLDSFVVESNQVLCPVFHISMDLSKFGVVVLALHHVVESISFSAGWDHASVISHVLFAEFVVGPVLEDQVPRPHDRDGSGLHYSKIVVVVVDLVR